MVWSTGPTLCFLVLTTLQVRHGPASRYLLRPGLQEAGEQVLLPAQS